MTVNNALRDFSVVTPSLNMLQYLRRCCASVTDQKGASCEHIVVDGCSTDGSVEWLTRSQTVRRIIAKDTGMYEAINRGLSVADGKFVSYLNTDEQYLPGTLNRVKGFFQEHQDVDIVFGDALITNPDGTLIAFRKAYSVRWPYVLSSHLYALSCTMFMRRRVLEEGLRFDASLRYVADMDLVVRVLQKGHRVANIPYYLAAFTMRGNNLSGQKGASSEKDGILKKAPTWVRLLRVPLNAARLAEKLCAGAYWERMPLEYSLYVSDDPVRREPFRVARASSRWRTA